MAKLKTKPTDASVTEFIQVFADTEQKRHDSMTLIEMMRQICGCEPYMWGPSIIGFGSYHYQYASGHEGDAPILGFSPRKAAISLYIYSGTPAQDKLLKELGKFKMGKACIYIKKLSDIRIDVLKEIMKETIRHHQKS